MQYFIPFKKPLHPEKCVSKTALTLDNEIFTLSKIEHLKIMFGTASSPAYQLRFIVLRKWAEDLTGIVQFTKLLNQAIYEP